MCTFNSYTFLSCGKNIPKLLALRMKSDDGMSKETFGIDKYLELLVNERKHRKALCGLRICSHKVNIAR